MVIILYEVTHAYFFTLIHNNFFLSGIKAEILWALHTVVNHYSANSSNKISNLFKAMFVDSKIANGFSMAKDKLSYFISFGLFPYYSSQLSQSVQKSKRFVLLFDESFNEFLNREQMDISIKFFCEERQMAVTRYWSSEFLQKATSADIERHLRSAIRELQLNCLLQVSMDGPNTNKY